MTKRGYIALCVAAVLAALYAGYAYLFGGLVHKALYTFQAEQMARTTLAGEPAKVSFARYDFFSRQYIIQVQSYTSPDTAYTVYVQNGEMMDDYALCVEGHENTFLRLNRELDTLAQGLMVGYPHPYRLVQCGFASEPEPDLDALFLDMSLEPEAPPFPVKLSVWSATEADAPTVQELHDRLRELAAITEKWGLPVDSFTYFLEPAYTQSGERPGQGETLFAEEITREQIARLP